MTLNRPEEFAESWMRTNSFWRRTFDLANSIRTSIGVSTPASSMRAVAASTSTSA